MTAPRLLQGHEKPRRTARCDRAEKFVIGNDALSPAENKPALARVAVAILYHGRLVGTEVFASVEAARAFLRGVL